MNRLMEENHVFLFPVSLATKSRHEVKQVKKRLVETNN